MSATALIIGGVVLVVLLVAGAVALGRAQKRLPQKRSITGVAEREAAMEAQVEVEEHDIEEMIAARNALRRRIGRPSIGEELGGDALDDSEEQN